MKANFISVLFIDNRNKARFCFFVADYWHNVERYLSLIADKIRKE